jgi:hypothetical protein
MIKKASKVKPVRHKDAHDVIVEIERCLFERDGNDCKCREAVNVALDKREREIRERIVEAITKDADTEDEKPDGYGWFVTYLRSLAKKIRSGQV